jgi:hypothetical protein
MDMKTEDLIDMLARGPDVRVDAHRWRRFLVPALAGLAACVLLMQLLLGTRHDIGHALLLPAFWIKFCFALVLSVVGTLAVRKTSAPGATLGGLAPMVGLPVVVLWGLAVWVLWQAPPGARAALVWGQTWRVCTILIVVLAVPVFIAALVAMKRRAPTRLRTAGAAAGLASGATAAMVYCLHCPEMSPAFVGVWYVLGIAAMALVGALIGPKVLSW